MGQVGMVTTSVIPDLIRDLISSSDGQGKEIPGQARDDE
jgi:hypothetical protein